MFRSFFTFLKAFRSRRERLALEIPEFVNAHKDLLIIIADPKTDELYCSYGKKFIRGQMGSKNEKTGEIRTDEKIVKTMMRYGRFKTKIDTFLLEVGGVIQGFRANTKLFYIAVHDALYALAKANRKT